MARRIPIAKLRGDGSFNRSAGRKPPRSITLIVCEGETEMAYFKAARVHYELTTAEVVLADNTVGSAPISVVQCAEEKCGEPGGYDKVFCVFDRDGHESFDRARKRIQELARRKRAPLPIKEAISIPCFELWVLLHFEQSDRPFNRCAEVIRQIRERHLPDYEKADDVVARQLVASVAVAVGNADWMEGRAEANDYNPFTSVHHVLRHFDAVTRQENYLSSL